MKKLLHIFWMPLTLAITLSSCSWEEEVVPPVDPDIQTRALTVSLNDDGEEGKRETVNTVRLIVFDNASTGNPTLDTNERIDISESNKTATGFDVTVKVKVDADKMVVAVVNEPSALQTQLGMVRSVPELESIMYDFGNILNANHTGFRVGQYMPMTGVKRGLVVAQSNTSQNPARTTMTVERAFARIDIYLKAAPGVTAHLIDNYTRISVLETYDKGYLAVGTQADGTRYQTGSAAANNFGRLLTVPASELLDHNLPEDNEPQYATWVSYGGTTLTEARPSVPTCSFYVPERTCTGVPSDKLKIRFDGIYDEDTSDFKFATFTLSEAIPQGGSQSQALEAIKRNNVYEIIGTVKGAEVTFDHFVVPWIPVGVGAIIDPQYFLRVSQDQVSLLSTGSPVTITAETDYDRDDRGFPAGIRLGAVTFYDGGGNALADSHVKAGWMAAPQVSNPGGLFSNVTFSIAYANNSLFMDCYALVELKAGNLTKIIKVKYHSKTA